MSELKCPFCQQELVGEGSDNYWCKKCNLERHIPALYGSQKLWQELIRTRKALEQSEICCAEWAKQALDYKAENIALSVELELTRKALDIAVDTLNYIRRTNPISFHFEAIEKALEQITETNDTKAV